MINYASSREGVFNYRPSSRIEKIIKSGQAVQPAEEKVNATERI